MYLYLIWMKLGLLITLLIPILHNSFCNESFCFISVFGTNKVFPKYLASSTITQTSKHITSFFHARACVCAHSQVCALDSSHLQHQSFFPLNGEENSHLHTPLEQSGSCLVDFIVRSWVKMCFLKFGIYSA